MHNHQFLHYDWKGNRPVNHMTDHNNYGHWARFRPTTLEWLKLADPLGCEGKYVKVGCFVGTVTESGDPATQGVQNGVTWQDTPVTITGEFRNMCNLDPNLITLEMTDIFRGPFNGLCNQLIVICAIYPIGTCMVAADGIHKLSV